MGDPDAASFAHQGIQRHGDTARRGLHRYAAILILAVEVRFAVGHDHEGTGHVRIDLARLSQPTTEQNRSRELVNPDRRDQQQLHLVAPPRKLGGDDRRKPQGNPGLRHEARPCVLPDRLGKPRQLYACRNAKPDESESGR